MAKYREKPVVIEAVQWDGSTDTANAFLGDRYSVDWEYENAESNRMLIPTLEGKMICSIGDWIIKGVAGEFYPCKDEIFKAIYEPV